MTTQRDTTYSYKGSDFVIENGILRGNEDPISNRQNNFGEFLLSRLRDAPTFVGQIDGLTGREEKFAEMTEKSVKCAMWMKEQNVKPGDVIGICTHNHMNVYVPCFASLYIGAVVNPWWSAGITREITRHFLTLTNCNVLFADEASAGLAVEVAKEINIPLKVVVFGNLPDIQSLDDIVGSQDSTIISQFECTKLSSWEDPALIVYTSGTTGLPKGAQLPHKSIFGSSKLLRELCKTKSTEMPSVTSTIFSSLAWVTGIMDLFFGVMNHETRVIYPEFKEESTFHLIEKYKINWMLMGVSAARRLEKSPARANYDLSSLKFMPIAGSALSNETYKVLVKSFPLTRIRQIYGMTELFGAPIAQVDDQPKSGSCGKIATNMMIKVIDTVSGVVLGPNQSGEACVKYPYMMTGYYKNPEATREVIDAEGWLHSGDLAYYDEEGNIFLTGRIKELIKYRGNHVSPAMVEKVLQAHPDVFEVAVVGVPHPVDDEHPIAFVVTKSPNAQVTKEFLQKLVEDNLPDYMKLRGGVEFLKEMPQTLSGKISRKDLRKLALSVGEP